MSDDMDLMTAIHGVPHVSGVELRWDPGFRVLVYLDSMDWTARTGVLEAVDAYINEPGQEWRQGAAVSFAFPTPNEFTEAVIHRRNPS